ncbi:MAG TPA: AAA family ATPase [Candidatus Limnocylindria bacterium]
MRLVVVGGAPATGKTTLAVALGDALGLPVITKDDIKESIAEPFPTGDREWSRRLGQSAYAVLWTVARRILSAGGGLVLESNFTRMNSQAALREVATLAPAALVLCRTTDEIRRRRFAERAARGRHRVHIDTAILGEWVVDDAEFLVDIGTPRLIVDTADGYAPDLARIVAFVERSA